MLDLEWHADPTDAERLEEPELEIALPHGISQPPLMSVQRGQLSHVEWIVARLHRAQLALPEPGPLGRNYQAVVNEFQPLLAWTLSCWDYLLSTEGCRFTERTDQEKLWYRGDYRPVLQRDFSRLAHRAFRQCVLDYAQTTTEATLAHFLKARLWPTIVVAYRRLAEPSDPRQRRLTPYSYLRCVPYQFLNACHQRMVMDAVDQLPDVESHAVDAYFLHFLTLASTAKRMACSPDEAEGRLRRGLLAMLPNNRLAYCLLRQIERY